MDQVTNNINTVVTQPGYDVSTQESKQALATALLKEEQADCPVYHRFGPGIYIREAHYKAGTLVVGHEHLHEHTNILLKGCILVSDGANGTKELTAPYMFVAQPGSKVGYVLEDVVWQNIYATTETDLEVLERSLFASEDYFKKHLKLKAKADKLLCEEDRNDYNQMLLETGWTEELIRKVSDYPDDKIPFPTGSYSVTPGESNIQGRGLFATAPFLEGMVVAPARLGSKRTPAGYLVNHAKNPNTKAVMNDNGDIYLVATSNICGMKGGYLGDEITLDYRQIMKLNNLWNGEIQCQQQ